MTRRLIPALALLVLVALLCVQWLVGREESPALRQYGEGDDC